MTTFATTGADSDAKIRRGPRPRGWSITTTDWIVLGLIAGQLALRGWASASGWFYQDDFLFASDAASTRLNSSYLAHAYNGHVVPGAWLWAWIQIHVFGMNWAASVAIQLLLSAVTGLVFWAVLRMWFGPRRILLIPIAIYLFSPITLGAYLWWASALNHQPMQLAAAVALFAHLKMVRTGRTVYAALAIAAVALGLLFFEKSVVIVPMLFGVSLLVERRDSLFADALRVLRQRAVEWAGLIAVSSAFYVFYFENVDKVTTPARSSVGEAMNYALTSLGKAAVPSLLGGPWTWDQAGFLGLAAPSPGLKYASWLVAAIVVIETSRRVSGAGRVWLVVASYLAVDLALVIVGRLSYVGPGLGREFRYIADASTIVSFAIALIAVTAVENYRGRVTSRTTSTIRAALPYVVAAYILSCWASTATFVDIWRKNPAEQYFAHLEADIALKGGKVSVHDREVPNEILLRLAFPKDRVGYLLRPFDHQPTYDNPNLPLLVADDTGRLRAALIQPARTSRPGPDRDCGYRARDGQVTVPLDGSLFSWDWTWRVAYLTGSSFPVNAKIGATTSTVQLHAGLHAFFIRTAGSYDSITISGVPPQTSLCVTEIVVGTPQPFIPPADAP
jgi:hypothetical protein